MASLSVISRSAKKKGANRLDGVRSYTAKSRRWARRKRCLTLTPRDRESEGRAGAFPALDRHLSSVRLDIRLHDGEAQARGPLPLRIGLELVEDRLEPVGGDAGAVVADPALDAAVWCLASPDDDLAARRVLDRVRDEILEHALEQAGVRVGREVLRYRVGELRAGRAGDRMEIVDERFDERPQVEAPALQLDARLGSHVIALGEHALDEPLEVLHVALERLRHPGGLSLSAPFRARALEHPGREGDRVERRAEIVRHEGQILVAAPLYL